GLYFGERAFDKKSFVKAMGFTGIIFAVAGVGLELTSFASSVPVIAGFLFAAIIRVLERAFAHSLLRIVSILVFFAAIGMLEPLVVANACGPPAWFLLLPLYLAIAVSSQLVGCFAGLFDRQILKRHFA